MGGKAILVLLLVVAGLFVTLWFTDQKPPVEKVDQGRVLQGRSLTNATKIRWQFPNTASVEVGHAADGRFEVKEPLRDIASMGYMTQIVNAWDSANMQATKYPDTEEGRAKTGLTKPAMTFVVEWEDDQRLEIEFGDEGTLGDTRFLRFVAVENSRIWEGGVGLIESMRVGLDDLRSPQVFRHASGTVTSVRLDQANSQGRREPVHLKLEKGEWVLLEPVTGRADPVAAQRFVTAITSLRVDHFQPGSMILPERDPDIRIEIRGAYGEEKADLWLQSGQVFGLLPGRGHIFTSDNNQYGQVFVNAVNNLRARILVPMGDSTFEELVELIIDPGQGRGERIRLLRTSQTSPWQMIEPVECKTSPTRVNEAAHALHKLVARAFVVEDGLKRPRSSDPRFGMHAARWSVTTRRVRHKEMHTLWFGSDVPMALGSDAEALVYACRSDEPDNVAVVQKQPLEVLQRNWLVYCDKQIRRQKAIVERLELEHQDGRKRAFVMQTDGNWVLEGTTEDRSEVGDFTVDILRDFDGKRAVDLRPGKADPEFGEPDWVLHMKRRNGDVLGLLGFWDRDQDKPLIAKGRGEQPIAFELNKSNSAALRAFWK